MTRQALNKFIEETEAAMTTAERREWFALSRVERQAAAWAAFVVINRAA